MSDSIKALGQISGWIGSNSAQRIILCVLAFGSLCLLLANLGNQFLWEDEAQTALISKTILTDGVPRGCDGKNFFSQEGGAEYGDNYLWRWHTWLPFYVLAGFYKIFGVTTFVSRLPFVLFGFGTVFMVYYFCRLLWPGTRISLIAAGLLAISVPFLILSRQCRYYSMAMFFCVLALSAYVAMLNRKQYAALMLFAASTLLFHTQHFYIVSLFAALLLHAAIFGRYTLKILLVVIAAVAIVNGPWLIWLAGMQYQTKTMNLSALVDCIGTFSTDIFHFVFPRWLAGILLIVFIVILVRTRQLPVRGRLFWSNLSLPVFFIVSNIVSLSVMAHVPYFRYIAPSIPLLIILIATIVYAAGRAHLLLAVLTVVLLFTTSRIGDYLYEITHDYDGPCEGIVRYLNEHGNPDDVVAITYGDMVLKFYTNMRIIGGLTGEPIEQAKDARWVVIRKYVHLEFDGKVRNYLLSNIDWSRYRAKIINYPDIPWENRESPNAHLFRTNTREDKVIIYERIK
jgi:4-amino-4-deoxy-L-arabinose transferase-like glycosyltransferase